MAGTQLEWMQKRLELKPDLVNLLSKTEYDCYDMFLDLENPSDIKKLFDEAKDSPEQWSSLFNAKKSDFNPATLRKLSKIPVVAKNMGEHFFTSIKSFEPETFSIIEETEDIQTKIDRHVINHIDLEQFLMRLKNTCQGVYQTISNMVVSPENLEVAIELKPDNTIVPTHNCLICQKELIISYDTRNGKLKQFFAGNMKKHLIRMHTRNGEIEILKKEDDL